MFTVIEIIIFCLKYVIFLPCLLFALFHGLGKLLFYLYPYEDDSNRTIQEIVSSRGFICEDHSVITNDGYILTLHRIVHPDNVFTRKYTTLAESGQGRMTNKPPVLLQHGMFSNSRTWLVASDDGHLGIDLNRNMDNTNDGVIKNKVDNNLAFALVKSGYDVFLGNTRGNLYSLKHETLNYLKDKEFWNCSMSELVKYDIPASINYIIKLTNHDTIGYIGFSQGTTSMLALMTQEEKYNNIIKPFIAMAPIANPHRTNPFHFGEQFKQKVYRKISTFCRSNPGPVLPLMTETIARYMCSNFHFRNVMNKMCYNVYTLSNYADPNRALIYTVTAGSHCMRRNLSHVLQNVENKQFLDYNYGDEINMEKYGSPQPPIFDLKKITNRFICFFYSTGDIVVRFEDVLDLKKRLSVPLLYDCEVPGYNHFDFQVAQNLGSQINNKIITLLNSTMKRRGIDDNDNHPTEKNF